MSAASSSSSPAASTEANVPPPVPAGHAQLYVKNLSFSSTEEGLGAFVEKTIGTKPQSVRIVTRRAGPTATRSRGYGFVTIVEGAKQTGIDKLNNVDFEGRVLAVVEAQPRDPNQPRPPRPLRKPRAPRTSTSTSGDAGASSSSSASSSSPAPKPDRKSFPDATQLYVNNLAFSSTGEELAALFESKLSSKPLDVEIVTFKFGRFKGNSRGFGFVWVANGLVDKALALDKTKLNDRELGVARANAPTASGDDASSSSDASARPRRQRQRRPRNANGDASGSSGDAAITNTSGGDGEAPDNRRRQSGGGESRGRGRGRPRRGSRGGRGGGAAASGSN